MDELQTKKNRILKKFEMEKHPAQVDLVYYLPHFLPTRVFSFSYI